MNIDDICAEMRTRFSPGSTYVPPSEAQVHAAELALGAKLPADYVKFLHLTHDTKEPIQILRIAPNGNYWHPVAHDIVDATLSRRKDGLPSRLIIMRKCGGDGGYDAFDTQGAAPGEYPVLHFTYQRGGIKAAKTGVNFTQWLAKQLELVTNEQ